MALVTATKIKFPVSMKLIASDQNGYAVEQSVEWQVTYRLLRQDDLNALSSGKYQQIHALSDTLQNALPDMDTDEREFAVLSELILGWSGNDVEGSDYEFNADNLREALNYPTISACLIQGLFRSHREGPRKN